MLLLAGLLSASASAADLTVTKSPNDQRDYRYIELANGLRVMLISEPDAKVSAAALDVHVGSGDDPSDRAGLAHFLEHMLFLGTDFYPDAGEYQAYVSSHGGSQNAYTSLEHTNYHFSVEAGALKGTLMRFARFFVAPMLDAQYVERERQVVQAEYSSKLKSDGRRSHSAFKAVINPKHPGSRFAVGNTDTLADQPDAPVRQALIAFYKRHYAAANMTLSVVGRESLDDLQAMVAELFTEVPTGASRSAVIFPALFTEDQLPARLDIVPQREYRSLSLTFPIAPLQPHYKAKPAGYIAHLLGHEGEGSLLSLLRKRGLANGLSAGGSVNDSDNSTFSVNVSLTTAGFEQLEEVVALIFAGLELIAATGPERSRYDELAQLNATAFRFQEPSTASSLAVSISGALHRYGPADVLYASYALEHYAPELIRDYLRQLRPERMLMTVTAPGLATDQRSKYYDAPYRVTNLDLSKFAEVKRRVDTSALKLPTDNTFIAADFALLPDFSSALPAALEQAPGFELWHQQDTSFGVPLASFYVALRTNLANSSARNSIMTQLLVGMLNEQLDETTYPAAIGGLNVRLYKHLRGLSFRVSGYSDKQAQLVTSVVDAIQSPVWSQGRFDRVRERLIRALNNAKFGTPYSQAMSHLVDYLLIPQWSNQAHLDAVETVSLMDVQNFSQQLVTGFDIAVLAHGNINQDAARRMAADVRGRFAQPAANALVKRAQVLRLERGESLLSRLHVDHADKALVVYMQGRGRSLDERAGIALLTRILSSPFYTELRTNQQLGYVVFASAMPLVEVPAVSLVIQSPTHDPATLATRAQMFLSDFAITLQAMPAASFEEYKRSLRELLLEPDKTLSERSSRYWTAIDRSMTEFDARERMAVALQGITLDDLVQLYRDLVVGEGAAQIAVHATNTRASNDPALTVEEFRAGRARF